MRDSVVHQNLDENFSWDGSHGRSSTYKYLCAVVCMLTNACVCVCECFYCFMASITLPAIITEHVPAVCECTSLALFSPSQMQCRSKEWSTFCPSLSKQSLSLHHLSQIIDQLTTFDPPLFIQATLRHSNEKFYRNWGKYFSKHFPTSTDHTLHNLLCFFHRYVS